MEDSISKEVTKLLDKFSLTRLPSTPKIPAQHRAAKVSWNMIIVLARTLRVEASLAEYLWL